MTSYSFIRLWDDTSGSGGKVRVIQSGRNRTLEKTQGRDTTIGGGLDITMGGVYEIHNYTIRVCHDDPIAGYISYEVLEYLYRLNNPNGSPSNLIKFTDHYGVLHDAHLTGNFDDSLLGCSVEGETAWWIVKLKIEIKPSV